MRLGIEASYSHPENGMTKRDMYACKRAADQLNEIIIFRSTGPWSKRWLEATPPYPSKNFHVKGKSSDWGPMAGFVPYDGTYSKVGHETKRDEDGRTKAEKGTAANDDGLASGHADRQPLRLTMQELRGLHDITCEVPRRSAIDQILPINQTDDLLILVCRRPGDGTTYFFLAQRDDDKYLIKILPRGGVTRDNAMLLADHLNTGRLRADTLPDLLVMTSQEAGADRRPMTGDYDLMAVCPRWETYMSRSNADIEKPAIQLNSNFDTKHADFETKYTSFEMKLATFETKHTSLETKHAPLGQTFPQGSLLDKVLDMKLHTGAKTKVDAKARYDEHDDMGNLTPRILRAINMLNLEMGATGDRAALRRVHHNAESHRNLAFGALTAKSMTEEGDGFPLTAFQPASAMAVGSPLAIYGAAVTLERMTEFEIYCQAAFSAGYYVPKNWTWGMSIRDANVYVDR